MLPSLLSTTALLYYLCFALLLGMCAYVLVRSPRLWLNRSFALTGVSLLVWIATLFVYGRTTEAHLLLSLGRANFAAMVFTVFLAYLLVQAIAGTSLYRHHLMALGLETLLLGLLTTFTPSVDRAELLVQGTPPDSTLRHATTFGPLAVLYFAHILLYLAAAIVAAFRYRATARTQRSPSTVRDQLLLVGSGMMATGFIAFVTNVLLPFGFDDFRFIDLGPLSTLLFLLAVAYAIVRHHLFDIRLFVRKTLVWGLLLTFVMSVYSALVLLVTDRLTQNAANSLTRFGVLILAFSFDPLRRFLEQRVDRLLFPAKAEGRSRRS